MDAIAAGALAYGANVFTVFALYPYRDFVKYFHFGSSLNQSAGDFCLGRYRGMLSNPSQPLFLAAPYGALFFGYVLGPGPFGGALLGGTLHGFMKTCVARTGRRMSMHGGRYKGRYDTVLDCIISGSKEFGVYSTFAGATAVSLISILWYGSTLAMLQRTYDRGYFFENFWTAFRAHAFMTFLTAPLRNVFRSSLSSGERSGGVRTATSFVRGEAAIFREAMGVGRHVLRSEGIPFFLNGVLRTTFKTSVPFGFSYALFKWMGGSIGYATSGGNHGHHIGRRSIGRF
ncbi:hypothetical protein STCU_05022 [Strigomonas culicis]|uniref:Mitochondrial carrier protein n=1 Tax=Strigomonas culicis TaxID=28005 RepID=S9UI13_9TRYP|nr:hypothetical protein STCU_07853 [Strigomonas culicis]EPY25185.1 hypothetical protein STCU_06800 [Strigomonas culicis]EPY28558.1 hypothetical protein STCU_05022 [Strigomonas culicis]|eukprot:EPY23136.1 hypothetical protein STCU_07853 [Strigomonas culicis]